MEAQTVFRPGLRHLCVPLRHCALRPRVLSRRPRTRLCLRWRAHSNATHFDLYGRAWRVHVVMASGARFAPSRAGVALMAQERKKTQEADRTTFHPAMEDMGK